MNSTTERILSLKVYDAMTESVVSVNSSWTMAQAANLLRKYKVTGAPVVDEHGRCVGVLSGSDYVRNKAAEWYDYPPTHVLSKRPVTGAYYCEEVLNDLVGNHMSPAVQTISQTATLLQAARCLCGEHIHRLVVLDDTGTPVGILSSLDVVAAFVATVEE